VSHGVERSPEAFEASVDAGSEGRGPSAGTGPVGEEQAPTRGDHLRFVSHEIRNPLAAALWSAELLARLGPEERGGARGEKLARTCLRALQRLRRLTEDHLLSERLDARGFPVALEAIPAAELLPEEPAALGADRLEVDLAPGIAVAADPVLARRALEAAVLAAAREGGVVRVEGSVRRGVVRLRVTGAPPRPAALRDPGRGDPSDPRGAALSLGAARRAAAATGGTLRVEAGAFLLELPEASAAGQTP
jgi:signal transduction histidine kinase